MKCPICGGVMEKKYAFSGDLYQSNNYRYVCRQCGHSGPDEEDILAAAARKILKEMEENGEAEVKRVVRIHLHCDNRYDHIPDSEWTVPYEEGVYPLKGEPFGRDVAGGDIIHNIQVEGNEVIFNGQRYCLEQGDATVKAKFMYYRGIVPNPLYYTITLSLLPQLPEDAFEQTESGAVNH